MKINSIILLLIIVLNGCQKELSKNWPASSQFQTIKIHQAEPKEYLTSDLFESVSFIRLEGQEEKMGQIVKMIVTKNTFYFLCSNGIYIYDDYGNFKTKIDFEGMNDSEYVSPSDLEIDTVKQQMIVYDSKGRKFVSYNLNGEFVENWPNNIDGYSAKKITDQINVVYVGASFYNEKINHKLNYVSKSGELIKGYFPIEENETHFMHFADINNFYEFKDITGFLYSFNDTIYSIDENNVSARYVIDFGSQKLPKQFLEKQYSDVRDFYETVKKTGYVLNINGFLETENHLVFSFVKGSEFIQTIYSKSSDSSKVFNNTNDDLKFAGINIPIAFSTIPRAMHENKIYALIDSHIFLQQTDSVKSKLSPPDWENYKKTNPDTWAIYQQTSLTDNPIISITSLKNF